MAYDYGSSELRIENPFRFEGFLIAIRGGIVTVLGSILALASRGEVIDQIQSSSVSGQMLAGAWMHFIGGILLLVLGLGLLALGLFRLFRFYVGRNIPANLAPDKRKNAPQHSAHQIKYPLNGIQEMLLARINPTFSEPRGWIERLLLSLFHRLIFLPAPLRNVTLNCASAGILSMVILTIYGLAMVSGEIGLTSITQTPVGSWLGWTTVAMLLFGWWQNGPISRPANWQKSQFFDVKRLVKWIVVALFLPIVLTAISTHSSLPSPGASPVIWLLFIAVLSVISVAFVLYLALVRAPENPPLTEVSEFRDHWQEAVHPQDIFRAFEHALIDHRFLEIPNREYDRLDPGLVNATKGEFSGALIQEVQPIPLETGIRGRMLIGRVAGLVLGQVLLLLAAIWLFQLFRHGVVAEMGYWFNELTAMATFFTFGGAIYAIARIFSSEIFFESRLVQLSAEGTFNKSKVSAGMAYDDTLRSENELVRTSTTPWILVSRVVSSTLATSGTHNLEHYRYVLELRKDDQLTQSLVERVRQFIRERQLITGVTADSDIATASVIHQVNQGAKARSQKLATATPNIEQIQSKRLEDSPGIGEKPSE